ncbi:hypothetical protein [Streptomyces uncialis]|uniref:hypothetical protein n=1 Tax=Streptomyces uncialis TaxID=1048205 RepID=UPI00224C9AC6|nr:hypothetical protein [Streptomyces uncialis]MCX4661499.1 hypothetical protein [Streptomyces uncialis]
MARIRFEFDSRSIRRIMQSDPVRQALKKEADAIAPRARALARAELGSVGEEFADSITVSEETRPRGRPTAKVTADRNDASDHEYGAPDAARRRILGRAARTPPPTP